MAGIGFELKKAIRDESTVKKTGGYFGAAFSSSGSMIIGIIIFCIIQYTAGVFGVNEKTKDIFMCYITNTMFFSMICTSAVNLVLSRYVSDRIYLKEYKKILPSLIGGISLTSFIGGMIFLLLTVISGVNYEEIIVLFLLFESLSCCWILMNYISVLRDYIRIIVAYLSGFAGSVVALFLVAFFNALTLISMTLVLAVVFIIVDIVLFRAVYLRYPLSDESVMGFLSEFKYNPYLSLSGLLITIGTLGHFFVVWFISNLGEQASFLFRFSSTYDFPVIVAYFSTIPASIYFITLFETDFSKKYRDYFITLEKNGSVKEVALKRENMLSSIEKGIRNICKLQIITCLLFITLGSQILYVLNIGMTELMLNNFRLFCVGYSVYYLGYTVFLIHLYFMNEKRVFKTIALFAALVIFSTVLFSFFRVNSAGFGFFAAGAAFTCLISMQLFRYLNKLEYNVLCGQPIIIVKKESKLSLINKRFSSILNASEKRRFRINKKAIVAFAIVTVLFLTSTLNVAMNAYIESRILRFYPKYSQKTERSPRIGFAPWAENKETKELNTSLVYVELKWSDWEPEEGKFNVDYVYEHYKLNYYKADGRQVVFRFICDEPTEKKHIDIPNWLFDITNGDGEYYHNDYGYGYSPNYKNKDFIECHSRAVKALGDCFGKDEFFTYVELGSLGHWGEWHTDYEHGVSHMPSYDVRKKYITPYINAFPNAQFMIRYPLVDAKDYGFGYYNDLTGDYDETVYWLKQMNGGIWEQTGLKEQLNDKDIWKSYPIGGEFASTYSDSAFMVSKFSMTLEAIKMSHQSFIGPKIIIDESDNDYRDSAEKILRTLGYRFTVTEVDVNLFDSNKIDIDLNVVNKGIAPIYKPYSLWLELYDKDNNLVLKKNTKYNLMRLLPSEKKKLSVKINRDSLDDDEIYSVRVYASDKQSKNLLPLALEKKSNVNKYEIAKFSME